VNEVVKGRSSASRESSTIEAGLSASERWFEALVANSSDLLVVLDADTVLTYANPASRAQLGFAQDSRTGHTVFDLIHPEDHQAATSAFLLALEGGSTPPFVVRVMNVEGDWRFVEAVLTNCLDDPAIGGVVVNAYDITERVHLTRALRVMTDVHKILVGATSEEELLSRACESLVAKGAIKLAFVGYLEPDPRPHVAAVARAGRTEFLDDVDLTGDENEFDDGVLREVLATGVPRVVNDVRRAPELARWQDRYEATGIVSGCALPLVIGSQVVGVLVLHSDEVGFFGVDEVELFSDLAKDLAYGIGRLRDAARLVENETRLRDSEQRFRLAFEANAAPMLFSDLEDRVIDVNDAFCKMVGFARDELLGRDSRPFSHPDDVRLTEDSRARLLAEDVDQARYIKRYVHRDGHVVTAEVTRTAARDDEGRALYFVASERDVTEEHKLAAQLSHQALHDPLTGLANRTLLEDRLAQAFQRVVRQGGLGAILLIDLDDFKQVNDSHGHLAGDALLEAVARRLQGVCRGSDTLARFGGDEFIYLAEGLATREEVDVIAKRFRDALAHPFVLEGKPCAQRVSIGVSVFDGTGASPGDALRDADLALYEAKSRGKSRYVVFTDSLREEVATYHSLARDLRDAMDAGDLELRFQPVVELASSAVVGFETLLRWEHPTRGSIPPSQFISIADESDCVVALSAYTLYGALEAAQAWPTRPGSEFPMVGVNMTARQFLDEGFVRLVDEALASFDLDAARLTIEVSEEASMRDAAGAAATVEALRRRGVNVALDDFGTGVSSLVRLKEMVPDYVKVDVSIVREVSTNPAAATMLKTILDYAQRLDQKVLVEGVEDERALRRVMEMGARYGQGFHFAPALDAEVALAVARDGLGALQAREARTTAQKSAERATQSV
jgi:diguanylate cyclase (GGDEF)-like protein/PAS domain S-box-containing protein